MTYSEHELEFTFAKNGTVVGGTNGDRGVLSSGLPLTGVRAYYTPEYLAKTPKIRWPGVRVRPK